MPKSGKMMFFPIVVVLGLGYIDFVVFYSLGYEEIFKQHSKGVLVSLWVIVGILELLVFIYWGTVLLAGPGVSPVIEPYDLYLQNSDLSPAPDYFMCDEYGFPHWCSECQSLMAPRSFHLKRVKRCVLKYDHFCLWVGVDIGSSNYNFFLKLVWIYGLLFLTILIYLLRYTKSNYDRGSKDINHNFIVLYVLCGLFNLFIWLLFMVHVYYISCNMTTLDDITRKQHRRYKRWLDIVEKKKFSFMKQPRIEKGVRYVNMAHKNSRAVTSYSVAEYPFSLTFKENWVNLWLSLNNDHRYYYNSENKSPFSAVLKSMALFLLPFYDIFYYYSILRQYEKERSLETGDEALMISKPAFSSEFQKRLHGQLDKHKYWSPLYLGGEKAAPSSTEGEK